LDSDRIFLSTEVTSVRNAEPGYSLSTAQGSRDGYTDVVLSVPTWVAARQLADEFGPVTDAMGSIRYVSSGAVFFAYRRSDLGDRLRGYGFLVPDCEGRRINGATWISNKFDHRSPPDGFLVRCYIGGDRTAAELELDDDGMITMCREELREIAGITAEPIFSRVYRWKQSNPQYDVGHAERSRWIDAALAQHPGLHVTGSGFRGIGLPDCVKDGRETARRLIR